MFNHSGDEDAPEGETVVSGADCHAPPDDPIVTEVRAVREALFAEAAYDLDEFVRRIRSAQARSSHAVVTLPPKPVGSAA